MKYYLSVLAFHRNEGKHLQEWLEYHLAVGVQHFYLLDNNEEPDPATERILRPYIHHGLVTNTPAHIGPNGHNPSQASNYTDFLKNHRDSEWVAVIDCDEFLCPRQADSVPEVLAEYEEFAGLAVNWRIWGSSGLRKSPRYVIEKNIRKSLPGHEFNEFLKSIVRPTRIGAALSPHSFESQANYVVVNEKGAVCEGHAAPYTDDKIVLNHFAIRSQEDFELKRSRGRCSRKDFPDNYQVDLDRNEVLDTKFRRRFLAKVKRGCRKRSALAFEVRCFWKRIRGKQP